MWLKAESPEIEQDLLVRLDNMGLESMIRKERNHEYMQAIIEDDVESLPESEAVVQRNMADYNNRKLSNQQSNPLITSRSILSSRRSEYSQNTQVIKKPSLPSK